MTTTERIKTAFDQYIELPLEGWKAFTDLGEIVIAEKDEIIKRCNTTENYLYFILSGSGAILIWNKTIHYV
jgi:4-diphosphocytidyl-2C-methyl-D-erythritol kinase